MRSTSAMRCWSSSRGARGRRAGGLPLEPHPRIPVEDLSVIVGDSERNAAQLEAVTLQRVSEVLAEHGVVVLRQVWKSDAAVVDALVSIIHANYEACSTLLREREIDPDEDSYGFKQIIHRSHGRFDMQMGESVAPVPLLDSLADAVFGDWHRQVLEKLLGADYRVNLPAHAAAGAQTRSHVLMVAISSSPMGPGFIRHCTHCKSSCPCDMDAERGPTGFWPALTWWATRACGYDAVAGSRGEARRCHSLRLSSRTRYRKQEPQRPWRPILYQTCSRSWFFVSAQRHERARARLDSIRHRAEPVLCNFDRHVAPEPSDVDRDMHATRYSSSHA